MEIKGPPRHLIPKEGFCSKSGAVIVLGHFKNHDANPEVSYKTTFIVHDQNQKSDSFVAENKGGLRKTRFHKGFERKNERNIENVVRDEKAEYSSNIAGKRSEMNAEFRGTLLKTIDNYNGFNLITGMSRSGPGSVAVVKPEGIRSCGADGLGPEAPLRGNILLRDSPNRFFTPQYSGPSHEYRQNILINDGVFEKRASSIIQLGKKDLPSAGVEDQFSKSQYTKLAPNTSTGLVEMREPGKYTPRKQFGNPSGNFSMTEKWGKGISLVANDLQNQNRDRGRSSIVFG